MIRDPAVPPARPVPRIRGLGAAIALLWMVIATALALTVVDGALDDAFITYRYAANLAAGNGLVYNVGDRVFGITEPGYGLLLGALRAIIRIPVPILGTVVTGLALTLVALRLAEDGRRAGFGPAAAAGATLVVASTQIWVCHGFAAPLAVSICLVAASLADRRPALAGVAAGLAVWTRPDAGVAVAGLGLLLWIKRRAVPWRYGIGSTVVVLLGALAALLYYGTPLPTTLEAKRLMADAVPGVWGGGWRLMLAFAKSWRIHLAAAALPVAALGVLGVWRLGRTGGLVSRTLLLYATGVAVGYPLLGVGFYPWYLIPVTMALLHGAGVGAWWGAEVVVARAGRNGARATAAVVTAALLAVVGARVVRLAGAYTWPSYLESYRRAAEWIRDRSVPGDAVALREVGVVGYYSGLPVVDLLGLVTPEAMNDVRRGQIGLRLRQHPTTWVVDHSRRRAGAFAREPWFEERYRVATRIADTAGGEVAVYRLLASGGP